MQHKKKLYKACTKISVFNIGRNKQHRFGLETATGLKKIKAGKQTTHTHKKHPSPIFSPRQQKQLKKAFTHIQYLQSCSRPMYREKNVMQLKQHGGAKQLVKIRSRVSTLVVEGEKKPCLHMLLACDTAAMRTGHSTNTCMKYIQMLQQTRSNILCTTPREARLSSKVSPKPAPEKRPRKKGNWVTSFVQLLHTTLRSEQSR